MKRIITLAAIILALVACKKDEKPSITVNPATATLLTAGGTVNANITAGGTWSASCTVEGVSVSPSSAAGDSPVSISVPTNTTGSSREIIVTFTCKEGGNSTYITINQEYQEESISIEIKGHEKIDWDFCGGTEEITIESNYPWTAEVEDNITVAPESGDKGSTNVTVTILPNTSKDNILSNVRFKVTRPNRSEAKGISYNISAPYLSYGDVEYPLVKLKDGNIWMAASLRYVPEGKTVSDDLTALDNGLWYPVKVNEDGSAAEFDKSDEGIAAKGYLYTTATAFGVARGTITEENAASFEGCQGICPEGWHLPTVTEMVNLVGKCNNGALTNTDAPYYDPELGSGSGSIAWLETDNWPIVASLAGMIQLNKDSDTAGTLGGATGTPKALNTGYFTGSSFYKKTSSNIQFYGLMPALKQGNIAAGYNNITNGTSIRCVKDKAQE